MGRVTTIFCAFILYISLLVQAKDNQQSDFNQIYAKLYSGHLSADQGSRPSGSRIYSPPWKQATFFFEKQTSNMSLIRLIRDTGVLTTSSPTNTELTTSKPEVLNTDTLLIYKSAFETNGPSDDLEHKTDSTAAAKPETQTKIIPKNTKDLTVDEPVPSTTTTSSANIQRDDKLFYSNEAVRRKYTRSNKFSRPKQRYSNEAVRRKSTKSNKSSRTKQHYSNEVVRRKSTKSNKSSLTKQRYSNEAVRRKSTRSNKFSRTKQWYSNEAEKQTKDSCWGTDCFQVDFPSIFYPDPMIPNPNPMMPNPDPWLPCPNPSEPCNSPPNRIKGVSEGLLQSRSTKIVGGEETTIEKHPYQASLQYIDHPFCGGTILNRDTILTAAHCFAQLNNHAFNNFVVKVGASNYRDGLEYKASKVISHKGYDNVTQNNDIAILKLAKPLTFSNTVQPIELQPANEPVPQGVTAVVTGWGTTVAGEYAHPTMLQMAAVGVITNELCQSMYQQHGITTQMLCAITPGRDSCQGDSGGPLVANDKLIGVVSFGDGCANPNFPGVYANISALRGFICYYM